ncbi:MAG: hypothetical protein E7184_00665 [Erysipelotrichaceae bacterium]|nr:hypothetical protein [Erysipelotrichaceae bacterium]
MLEFLRMFGQGVFYTIISPILFAIWAVHVVFVLIVTLVYEVKNILLFFTGRTLKSKDSLEKEMEVRKQQAEALPPGKGGTL